MDHGTRCAVLFILQVICHVLDERLLILTHVNLARIFVTDLRGNELALTRVLGAFYLLRLLLLGTLLHSVIIGVCVALVG